MSLPTLALIITILAIVIFTLRQLFAAFSTPQPTNGLIQAACGIVALVVIVERMGVV